MKTKDSCLIMTRILHMCNGIIPIRYHGFLITLGNTFKSAEFSSFNLSYLDSDAMIVSFLHCFVFLVISIRDSTWP